MATLLTRTLLQMMILWLHFKSYEYRLASQKCEEYAKAVYVQKDSPVLSVFGEKTTESECGISAVPLIIGGTRASEKEFPHMVTIGFGDSPRSIMSWSCGGSLISDLYILTAAHCLSSRQFGSAQKVRLGVINIDDDQSEDLEERNVVARIPHPEYRKRQKVNDIALLKMDRPVEFTATVRPACLNTGQVRVGEKALASGFGKLKYESDHGSPNLMKVTLSVYGVDQCSSLLKHTQMNDSVICAGELKGGRDTCQGDSGGPLQTVLTKPYCMYSIIGVTSFGRFCGFSNSPAIYTKVSHYLPWIEGVVWR